MSSKSQHSRLAGGRRSKRRQSWPGGGWGRVGSGFHAVIKREKYAHTRARSFGSSQSISSTFKASDSQRKPCMWPEQTVAVRMEQTHKKREAVEKNAPEPRACHSTRYQKSTSLTGPAESRCWKIVSLRQQCLSMRNAVTMWGLFARLRERI